MCKTLLKGQCDGRKLLNLVYYFTDLKNVYFKLLFCLLITYNVHCRVSDNMAQSFAALGRPRSPALDLQILQKQSLVWHLQASRFAIAAIDGIRLA